MAVNWPHLGHVRGEPQVVVIVLVLVREGHDGALAHGAHLRARQVVVHLTLVAVRDGGVQPHHAALHVVDRAHLGEGMRGEGRSEEIIFM